MKRELALLATMVVVLLLMAGCATTVPGLTQGKTLTTDFASAVDPGIAARLSTPDERQGWWKEVGRGESPYFGKLEVRDVNLAKATAHVKYTCEETGGATTGWSGKVKVAPDGSFSFRPEWGRNFSFRLLEDGSLSGNASIPEGQFEVTMK